MISMMKTKAAPPAGKGNHIMGATFTPAEIAYLQSQRLGRLATVGADGQPHVVPVAFRFNAETGTIDIGGHSGFAKRKKYRDVQHDPRVAFVVDDLASVSPRAVRGIEVRGTAEILATGGADIIPGFDDEMFHIDQDR
jgi:pyridoxamine 5'-phosphate oxidase family protein